MLWNRLSKKDAKPKSEWAVQISYSSPEKFYNVNLIRNRLKL